MKRNRKMLNTFLCTLAISAGALPTASAGQDAMTLWWVIFNDPSACENGCDPEDFANPAVGASVVYSSGAISGRKGRTRLAGSIYESQKGFQDEIIGGPGLLDADRAEVHMVVRSHGPRDRALELEQITQFLDSGCEDLGGSNECRDVQFSVHMPGQNHSQADVFWFPDLNGGSAVSGATSDLFRQSDGLRIVLRTNTE